MRAYVILFIAMGTLLPVLVIIMCPTGGKIMSQNIAIFRTANCAFCSLGAGCRAAGVFRLMKHRAAGADLPVFRFVGFPVAALVVMGVALSIEHGQGYFAVATYWQLSHGELSRSALSSASTVSLAKSAAVLDSVL